MKLLITSLMTISILILTNAKADQSTPNPVPTPDVSLSQPKAVKSSAPKASPASTHSKDSKKKPEVKSTKPAKKPYKAVRKILTEDQKKELQAWFAAKVKAGQMTQKQVDDASKYSELGVYDVMKSETARKKK